MLLWLAVAHPLWFGLALALLVVASVVLTLHPGRTLERAQVAGIVHLVSSSVPELNAKAVSVLDTACARVAKNCRRWLACPMR